MEPGEDAGASRRNNRVLVGSFSKRKVLPAPTCPAVPVPARVGGSPPAPRTPFEFLAASSSCRCWGLEPWLGLDGAGASVTLPDPHWPMLGAQVTWGLAEQDPAEDRAGPAGQCGY